MHIATAENTQSNIGNVATSSTKEVASIVTHNRYVQFNYQTLITAKLQLNQTPPK